jgi:hypothetical protein
MRARWSRASSPWIAIDVARLIKAIVVATAPPADRLGIPVAVCGVVLAGAVHTRWSRLAGAEGAVKGGPRSMSASHGFLAAARAPGPRMLPAWSLALQTREARHLLRQSWYTSRVGLSARGRRLRTRRSTRSRSRLCFPCRMARLLMRSDLGRLAGRILVHMTDCAVLLWLVDGSCRPLGSAGRVMRPSIEKVNRS